MSEQVPSPVSVDDAWASTVFFPERTPTSTRPDCFAVVTPYRDGGVFLANYAGESAWERHDVGDELVMVVEGSTTMSLWVNGAEVSHTMGAGELIVVPQDTWHRFSTPEAVKVMTVTPQPTDHHVGEQPPD